METMPGEMLYLLISNAVILISVVISYVLMCYGLHLLNKKYEPTMHPVLNYIPVVNLYAFVRLAGVPSWWIIGILIPLVNLVVIIRMMHKISKRLERGAGTTILLFFFSGITLSVLGRKVWNLSITPVVVWWIIFAIMYVTGFALMAFI
jgi:hypothetical protein